MKTAKRRDPIVVSLREMIASDRDNRLRCAILCGVSVNSVRNWEDGKLPRTQLVRQALERFVGKNGGK